MGVGRVAPAVALLLLLGQTHAYVGRAAKFLRKRVARRGRGGGAVSPPPNAPSDAPTPAPLPSLDTAAPRLSRRATSQAARPGIDGPDPLLLQVTPLAEHGPLDGLWNIYDQFVESIASSGKHVLSGKTPTEHYPDPTNVFVTSSALRQCGDTDTCSMGAEGSFDVVGFMDVDNSGLVNGGALSLNGGSIAKRTPPPIRKKKASKSTAYNSILYWKRGDAEAKPEGLPVTRLKSR